MKQSRPKLIIIRIRYYYHYIINSKFNVAYTVLHYDIEAGAVGGKVICGSLIRYIFIERAQELCLFSRTVQRASFVYMTG